MVKTTTFGACLGRKEKERKNWRLSSIKFQLLGCREPWPGTHSIAAYKIGPLLDVILKFNYMLLSAMKTHSGLT